MNFFGIDIGSNSIKVVQLEKAGQEYKLVAYGMASAPPKGFVSEAHVDLEILAESIRKLVKDARLSTNNTAIALSETQVYTRVITTPPLSEAELSSAIKWEAEQYIPLPLSDVKIDYQILSQPEKANPQARMDILLVAAPIVTINKYMKIMQLAGLKPVLMETEIISVARALVPEANTTTLLVDIGAMTSEIAVVRHGTLSFTRSIATGGNSLGRAVASELNLEFMQAEEYKKTYGLDMTKLSGKVAMAIKPVFDVIVNEMRRAISFYQKEKNDIVTHVVLTGGTSRMPGMVSYLAEVFGLEVSIGDPWLKVKMNDQARSELGTDTSLYATAVGLAMKNI